VFGEMQSRAGSTVEGSVMGDEYIVLLSAGLGKTTGKDMAFDRMDAIKGARCNHVFS